MVPVATFPPGMALTVQLTRVSVVPVTVGANVCVVPRSRAAVGGLIVTLMEDGAGVGVVGGPGVDDGG
jgi:hypothetical protein